MKRSRRTKIIATLGPASDSAEMMAKLFEAGADTFRLNMSHLARDRLREKVGAIREIEARVPAADRDPGRPPGAEAQGRHLRRRCRDAEGGHPLRSRFERERRRREARLPAPPRDPRLARGGPQRPRRRRQAETRGRGGEARARRHAGRGRRQDLEPQGRQPARHRDPGRGHDREGPHRPRSRDRRRRRLDRHVLRAAAGGRGRGAQDGARARAHHDEAREAAGDQPARRHPRRVGRRDGRPRRSRRRDAAREGAGPAEAHHPRRAPPRQAGGDRDPDARIDDHQPGADPRRGVRRRDRGLRGRRRRHALGRERLRPVPGRGGHGR